MFAGGNKVDVAGSYIVMQSSLDCCKFTVNLTYNACSLFSNLFFYKIHLKHMVQLGIPV